MMWLASLWHFVFGWPAVTVLVGMGATAVAILEPKQLDAITDLRKWAICVAVVAFSLTVIAGKFYDDGLTEKQRQWDAALAKEAVSGAKILDDARRDARADTPDSLRNDSWNRSRRDRAIVR